MRSTLWSSVSIVEQVALLGAAAGIADHAGGAAGQRERPVAGAWKRRSVQLADQVPDVAGSRRSGSKPIVEPAWPVGQPGRAARTTVGRVVDEAAGVEVGRAGPYRGHVVGCRARGRCGRHPAAVDAPRLVAAAGARMTAGR